MKLKSYEDISMKQDAGDKLLRQILQDMSTEARLLTVELRYDEPAKEDKYVERD